MAILKQNGFAARDYMIGFTALSMACTIAAGSNAPDYVASPANVAFAAFALAAGLAGAWSGVWSNQVPLSPFLNLGALRQRTSVLVGKRTTTFFCLGPL